MSDKNLSPETREEIKAIQRIIDRHLFDIHDNVDYMAALTGEDSSVCYEALYDFSKALVRMIYVRSTSHPAPQSGDPDGN